MDGNGRGLLQATAPASIGENERGMLRNLYINIVGLWSEILTLDDPSEREAGVPTTRQRCAVLSVTTVSAQRDEARDRFHIL
jgi:hypothetical protein